MHFYFFFFFLKKNLINLVLFIRNARAPSLKFMYTILNQSDNFKWVVRHFRIFQYKYFFFLLSDITYFDELCVCLLTGEIIQRIVCAVRAATNWPQSFMISIRLKPIRSRKSNEIDYKRCNYQDTGNF